MRMEEGSLVCQLRQSINADVARADGVTPIRNVSTTAR